MAANGYGVSIWGNDNVLELESGDGCNSIVIILCATELYTLKWLKW